MRLFSALLGVALFAALASAAPIETAGPSLTEDNFDDVKVGTWLIEHYSPYCHHCKAFAPKWKELVDLREKDAGLSGFHFAQVDCAANGDLCHKNGVKYYPTIFLFVDGVIYDEYEGKREVEVLSKYVDENMPGKVVWLDDEGNPENHKKVRAPAPKEAKKEEKGKGKGAAPQIVKIDEETETSSGTIDEEDDIVNPEGDAFPTPFTEKKAVPKATAPPPPPFIEQPHPEQKRGALDENEEDSTTKPKPDGKVHVIEAAELAAIRGKNAGASFVKYYAPWCGHCKALAPRWTELAAELEGIANVYEMDCDQSKNKKICAMEGVRGFPTLIFYNEGTSVEYKGKRDAKSMNHFALKAASATMTKVIANEYELKRATAAEDVVFLYLHSSNTTKEDTALAVEVSKVLLGGPPFYQSSSPDLFTLFSISPPVPTILVFKDHSLEPSELLALPPSSLTPKVRREQLLRWTSTAKLGVVTELNGATVGDLMPLDGRDDIPLLALAVLSQKGIGEKGVLEAKANLVAMAKEWKRMRKTVPMQGKDVVWSWVDGDKWAPWARSMFDVKMGGKEAVLVVTDVKGMEYWRTGLDGLTPLSLTDGGASVFTAIQQGIHTGALAGKSSKNYVERLGAKIVKHSTSLRTIFNERPLFLLFFVAVGAMSLLYAVRWCTGSSPRLSSAGTYPREIGGAKRE